MASVRALNSARTWTFAGGRTDLRSYLLCCFSFHQPSDKKKKHASKSETDLELAQYLHDDDDIDPAPSDAIVGGTGSPPPHLPAADGELDESHSQAGFIPNAPDDVRNSSLLATAADEIHSQQNTGQTETELMKDAAELSRLSRHGPIATGVTKEAPGDDSLPRGIIDPNKAAMDSQHDGRREPLANGLRPGDQLDHHSTPDKDRRIPEEEGDADADINTDGNTTTTMTTTAGDRTGETTAGQEIVNPESDEKLFDVSDLQEMSRCGRIHCTLDYSFTRKRLNVTVHEASEIPNQERGGSTNTQVRLALLPAKSSRHKTKIIRANENPKYDETFQFKLPKEELSRCGLRLRLYGCERLSRERMIGECIVRFVNLNLEKPSSNWFTLEPRISFADSSDRSSLGRRSRSSSAASSSSQSVDGGGGMEGGMGGGMEEEEGSSELLLSLAYNAVTGRLTVDVLQGTNLKYLTTNRPPDTYVRVTLMSAGGKELTRSNTSVRKMSPNPVYREKFMFQVVETQLAEVSLMVSVYAKRSLKREELVGWFILGYNNSGEDELVHWKDMRASGGSQVERWHVLAEP